MRIKELSISNFRCFKQYKMDFAPGVTVLFGKNGSGKTTIIHAIHKALSFMMYSDNVYETVTVKGKKKKKVVDVRTITNNNRYLHTKSFSDDDFNNHEDKLIEVGAVADFGDDCKDVEWKMSVFANNCKLRQSEFREAFNKFYNWHIETNELPVLAFFSDSFPHREDNKKEKAISKIRTLRNFGYFDWDEEEGCTEEWIKRLENNLTQQIQILSRGLTTNASDSSVRAEILVEDKIEFDALRKESTAIEECFKNFTDSVVFDNGNGLKVASLALGKRNGNAGKLCVVLSDGREYMFRKLPAGYMRIFSMVLDLAYRSYILSEGRTTDLDGLSIIDEIDLHLHPELEKVILPQLRKTFTKMQFIVSTHSNLVLTGVNTCDGTNKIFRLEAGQTEPSPLFDIYGLDFNMGLKLVMEVSPSDEELDRWISRCAYMMDNGMEEQAGNLRGLIVNKKVLSEGEIDKRILELRKKQ